MSAASLQQQLRELTGAEYLLLPITSALRLAHLRGSCIAADEDADGEDALGEAAGAADVMDSAANEAAAALTEGENAAAAALAGADGRSGEGGEAPAEAATTEAVAGLTCALTELQGTDCS